MIINDLQWKIGGEAGFGIMTTGLIFSRICSRGGLKTFAYPEYPSLIRGGHNTYQVYTSAKHASSQVHDVHLLVALNKETVALHADELIDGSAVIYDPKDFEKEEGGMPAIEGKNIVWVPVEMSRLITEHKAPRVERNTISIGASFGLFNYPWEIVEGVIRDWFGKKKPELADSNVALAKAGYEAVAEHAKQFTYDLEPLPDPEKELVISGNAAAALGALKAGMKFYAAYPMTPSSDFLSYFAKHENSMDLVVKHTEDEIAAINMTIGAGFAGARAMVATSGGGFALMGEALGMAGLAEVPIVVINGQRPGPSTGLPTWTSQADLRFVLHASQGEFPRIVLAPGDVEECFRMTFDAFNLAEKYQTPVVILLDKYNQQSWQSVAPFDTTALKVDRGFLLDESQVTEHANDDEHFLRHKYTEDGISPRCIPGTPGGRHIASSYEHEETGYTTEDEAETVRQNDKRFKKLETFLAQDAKGPEMFGPKDAAVTVVGWGSTKLPAMHMLRLAEKQNLSINYLHFTYIDPLPVEHVAGAFEKAGKTLCVEGNKLGQFEGFIAEHTGITMDAHFRKYGGRPFYPEEILAKAQELL